jgi:hypothetical protein
MADFVREPRKVDQMIEQWKKLDEHPRAQLECRETALLVLGGRHLKYPIRAQERLRRIALVLEPTRGTFETRALDDVAHL